MPSGSFAHVAVEDKFGDGVEWLADEEQWTKVIGLEWKGQCVADEFQRESHWRGVFSWPGSLQPFGFVV